MPRIQKSTTMYEKEAEKKRKNVRKMCVRANQETGNLAISVQTVFGLISFIVKMSILV